MKSKKCKKNVKEYLAKHPESDQSSIFKSYSIEGSSAQSEKGNILSKLDDTSRQSSKGKISESKPSGKVDRETALENPRRCLFSNKLFPGIKACLDHMRKQYSFTILDVDCLVDLKGLLEYIAAKIQIDTGLVISI